ncbi:MAG: TadE/TadG family type IV pilus assembly protein [Actinomycetes bacterium]|jgi:Flp pilus assembly protein TadG
MAINMFPRRALKSEKGAAAVEFAIILPLLLLLILLMIDFGRLFFIEISLNSASREAARGSSLSMSQAQITKIVNDSAPGVGALAALSPSGLVVTTSPCVSGNAPTATTTVTISTNFQWITPMQLVQFFDPNSTLIDGAGLGMNVSSSGQMLCSQS